ncbi:SGNH/GDSL hydrolase family protein [Clostridium sp. DL1XJH146]
MGGADIETNGYLYSRKSLLSLKDKKISIMGDSISTFDGYIPIGNDAYYPRGTLTNCSQTWWQKLIKETGMVLVANESWSGSRVATPPKDRTEAPFTDARRYKNLGEVDIIIVFGGINDFSQENPTELGSYVLDEEYEDLTTFRSAYQFLVKKLKENYPKAEIFCCIPTYDMFNGIFSENNAKIPYTHKDMAESIVHICDLYGIKVIDLRKTGLSPSNTVNYMVDADALGGGEHPNETLMELIKNEIIKEL